MDCAVCGTVFQPHKFNSTRLYCSRLCNRSAWLSRHGLLDGILEKRAEKAAKAKAREAEKIAAQEVRRKASEDRAAMLEVIKASRELRHKDPCAICRKVFVRRKNVAGRLLKYCSRPCSLKAGRNRPGQRASKAVEKVIRRNRLQAQGAERFDPIAIFDRDNWRCQICGTSTPQRLRGTHKPNAPELDHVIPLAKGGTHTRANVQCACRRCNATKSDKRIVGQMRLFDSHTSGGSSTLAVANIGKPRSDLPRPANASTRTT